MLVLFENDEGLYVIAKEVLNIFQLIDSRIFLEPVRVCLTHNQASSFINEVNVNVGGLHMTNG